MTPEENGQRDGYAHKLLNDSFEWNELIHTYYFRQPACCQFIVDTVTDGSNADRLKAV